MPSLLQKLSYFDPETGGTFTITGDAFLWKEGKKSPEDSKITRALKGYGWKLFNGNDAWLIFRQKGNAGELFVVRGNKRWFYDLRNDEGDLFDSAARGKGLDSLLDAIESGQLSQRVGKAAASPSAIAVNNAGNGHEEVEGDPLPEIHVFGSTLLNKNGVSRHPGRSGVLTPKAQAAWEKILASGQDKIKYYSAGGAILNDGTKIHSHIMKSLHGAGLVDYVTMDYETGKPKDPEFGWHFKVNRPEKTARELMHDDLGAQTGLRNRPDYGESDSYTSEMNEANSKGACLTITGSIKTDCCTRKADMYVTSVAWERGNSLKLASFDYHPDPSSAMLFGKRTAENLVRQMRSIGVEARIKQADESSLNGFDIMSLEDFVEESGPHQREPKTSAETETPEVESRPLHEELEGEVMRDQPATLLQPQKKNEEEWGFGSKHREMSDEEMREYMQRIEDRAEYEELKMKERAKNKGKKRKPKTEEEKTEEQRVQKERTHDKYHLPILHRGNIHIVDDIGEEYDLEKLKKDIMKRPERLLKKNEKMQHSGVTKQYYNVGLQALKGLVVNEKTGKFVVVDTCPGAGICQTYCYALRGNYVRVPQTSLNQARLLNFLVNDPKKFKRVLEAELTLAESKVGADEKVVLRWHDAGDFFSPDYLNMAIELAKDFPNIEFYAYTKVADVANSKRPDNFIINFSEGAKPEQSKMVDLTQIKNSITVPQQDFWDLIVTEGAHTVKDKKTGQVQFKNKAAWETFKGRLAEKYKINRDTILHYNEYMEKKADDDLGDKPKWNVVVPPGGGDDAANDRLVVGTYLMWH